MREEMLQEEGDGRREAMKTRGKCEGKERERPKELQRGRCCVCVITEKKKTERQRDEKGRGGAWSEI